MERGLIKSENYIVFGGHLYVVKRILPAETKKDTRGGDQPEDDRPAGNRISDDYAKGSKITEDFYDHAKGSVG